MRVLVIGGGASGMMAALSAAGRPSNAVTLLERQARVGRKLAATGNGRCNLSNLHASPASYHGGIPFFAQSALEQFPVPETLSYFRNLGLLTTTEPSGRVYPFSDQAGSVVDVLRLSLVQAGVEVVTGCEVTELSFQDGAFFAETALHRFPADRVIVACGGVAGGKLGGSLSGTGCWSASATTARLFVPPWCSSGPTTWVRSLKGVRAEAIVRLFREDSRWRKAVARSSLRSMASAALPCLRFPAPPLLPAVGWRCGSTFCRPWKRQNSAYFCFTVSGSSLPLPWKTC